MSRVQKNFKIEIRHEGLGKYKAIRGVTPDEVKNLAAAQLQEWDTQYARKLAAERRQLELQKKIEAKSRLEEHRLVMKESADKQTKEHQQYLQEIKSILNATLIVDDRLQWESLRQSNSFPIPRPTMEIVPSPAMITIPPPPDKSSSRFEAQSSFIDRFSKKRREVKEDLARSEYINALAAWRVEEQRIQNQNQLSLDLHSSQVRDASKKFEIELSKWEASKLNYEVNQNAFNSSLLELKKQFEDKQPEAMQSYFNMVLRNSKYPDSFPQEFELFITESGQMTIDYLLPGLDVIPSTREVKYNQSKDTHQAVKISEKERTDIYDRALYEITLRTLHEIFESDYIGCIEAVCFNGIISGIDSATGAESKACIVSVLASPEEFNAINLSLIDPKSCFKKLKGVGSSKLSSITPIAPILKMDKADSRFIDSYGVVQGVDESTNLASMDWEDFEHLVREVFEMEFASNGGEVKVTQASRDGGVDAIAFDPDPIRGGKIVIQAKRYTSTVGVSAVRDLYGTVLNEGATKGILVTTSDFGPDAYAFANGKPLTLLSGSNLLHLLARHGHRARIDVVEAKRMQGLDL